MANGEKTMPRKPRLHAVPCDEKPVNDVEAGEKKIPGLKVNVELVYDVEAVLAVLKLLAYNGQLGEQHLEGKDKL